MTSCARAAFLALILLSRNDAQRLPEGAAQPPNAEDHRLPNGKSQTEEILKSDTQRSLDDAKQLVQLATALEKNLEQEGAHDVLSLADIRRTEEIEKLAKRIRGRMRRY